MTNKEAVLQIESPAAASGDNTHSLPHRQHQHQKTAMTQETPPSTEAAKRELCDGCAGIQRNWRKAPGHPELVQGENRQEKRRQGLVSVTKYRCDNCGTRWEYENDKTNQKAGWSVVGR